MPPPHLSYDSPGKGCSCRHPPLPGAPKSRRDRPPPARPRPCWLPRTSPHRSRKEERRVPHLPVTRPERVEWQNPGSRRPRHRHRFRSREARNREHESPACGDSSLWRRLQLSWPLLRPRKFRCYILHAARTSRIGFRITGSFQPSGGMSRWSMLRGPQVPRS
jgi:hypothetical protein